MPGSIARGWRHRQIRDRLLAELVEGDPCFRCGDPMYSWQRLHADHSTPLVLEAGDPDVLSHGSCNESHGATLGNLLRGRTKKRVRGKRAEVLITARDW